MKFEDLSMTLEQVVDFVKNTICLSEMMIINI